MRASSISPIRKLKPRICSGRRTCPISRTTFSPSTFFCEASGSDETARPDAYSLGIIAAKTAIMMAAAAVITRPVLASPVVMA